MKENKFNIFGLWVLSILIFSSIFGCENVKKETTIEREIRMDEKVNERLEALRIEQLANCKKTAITIAESRVDSLLLAEAKMSPTDLGNKPDIPPKPQTPELLAPKDSSEIKPLFEEIPDSIQ